MSFNLFASPTQDDIKVGYIDPTLGYVSDASVCEANDYAKNNPGTTFIFRDGDNNIRYLNINEVNKLTPSDLSSTKSDKCPGIQEYSECGPPRIQFFGGGGIGAVGNPVIGKDGSLLAVDVVSGGHGYQYPPIVSAKDDCQIGNGAVLTAILGETADETEVFEGEEDFEEYEICEDTDVGYGLSYGPDGEELGPWDPGTYTRIGTDPIKREIEIFQKSLKNPFWTTRQKQPDRITVLGNQYATQQITEVTFPEWGEFMNKYAVSPVRPSDVRGSDEAGKIFQIEWEENFPTSGEYIFRGLCDNKGQLYIDDSLVGDLGGFDQNPSPIQKTIQEGNHIIRVDLLNTPFTKTTTKVVKQQSKLKAKFVKRGSNFYLDVTGEGSGEISFVMDVNDNPSNAGLAAREVIIPSDSKKVRFTRKSSGVSVVFSEGSRQVQTGQDRLVSGSGYAEKETIKESGTFTAGRSYGPIQIIGAGPDARGPIINSPNRLGLRDADGNDENIKITIEKTGNKTEKSSIEVGEVISPKSWNENPMGVALLIDAPPAPVPQEQLPVQTGPCPPNPIWSTRFPGADQTWYPVRNKRWANFFNRYAISPVLPLDTPGSDGSGIVHRNSWKIDIPYRGFYKFQAQRDNTARIYVDGNLAFDVTTSGDDRWVRAGLVNKVKSQKVFLEKGLHTISIELENTPQGTPNIIETKIFNTQDWRVAQPPEKTKLKAKFIKRGSDFYLDVIGEGSGQINFVMDVNDNPFNAGVAARKVIIPADNGTSVRFERETGLNILQEETIREKGKFTGGITYGPIEIIGASSEARGPIINSPNRLGLRDADGDDENIKITIAKIIYDEETAPITSSSGGVTYSGPPLIGYKHKGWSDFMNKSSVSPQDVNDVGTKTFTWRNVNFPDDGNYKFNFQADNVGLLKIGGKEIFKTSEFAGQPVQYNFNITKGKYDIVIELENTPKARGRDTDNPTGTALYITKDITFSDSNKTSWVDNPIGIGAILIPPPCAKKIGGRGVVEQVIVDDPGNGYLPVESPGTGYPVTLVLEDVIVEDGGINYRCGEDQIQITPSNGAELSYSCNSFGQISDVQVLNPGLGFDVYPEITIPSETGVNATFRPVFRVVRDPVQLLADQQIRQEALIQVTDLAGLKQTGYVDGRAYYGAIYYDAGVPYAGFYKTAGIQVRVYNTLQESITARVTTPASAIQRSGTDIRSNDPRLNIPGTIQDTTEQQ